MGNSKRRYRVKPHKTKLAPGVDPLRFNQLADELEDADLKRFGKVRVHNPF